MVVGDGGEIMAAWGWWWQTHAMSHVVVGGGGKIMVGRGWSHVLGMPFILGFQSSILHNLKKHIKLSFETK